MLQIPFHNALLITSRVSARSLTKNGLVVARRAFSEDTDAKPSNFDYSSFSNWDRSAAYRSPGALRPAPSVEPAKQPRRGKPAAKQPRERVNQEATYGGTALAPLDKQKAIMQYVKEARKAKKLPEEILRRIETNSKLWAVGLPRRKRKAKKYVLLDMAGPAERIQVETLRNLLITETHDGLRQRGELIQLLLGGQYRVLEPWINQCEVQKPRYRLALFMRRVALRFPGPYPDPICVHAPLEASLRPTNATEALRFAIGRGLFNVIITFAPPGDKHPFAATQVEALSASRLSRLESQKRDPRIDRIGMFIIGEHPIDGSEVAAWASAGEGFLHNILDVWDSFKNKAALEELARWSFDTIMKPDVRAKLMRREIEDINKLLESINPDDYIFNAEDIDSYL